MAGRLRGGSLGLGLNSAILYGPGRVWWVPGTILQILGQRAHSLSKCSLMASAVTISMHGGCTITDLLAGRCVMVFAVLSHADVTLFRPRNF